MKSVFKPRLENLLVLATTLFVAVCFCSCGNDEDFFVSESEGLKTLSYRITPQEAGEMALSFARKLRSSETRSGTNAKELSIKSIEPRGRFDNATRSFEKASIGDSIKIDTLVYVINFADSCGYAITSADTRTGNIYLIADDGNYPSGEGPVLSSDSVKDLLATVIILETHDLDDWDPYGSDTKTTSHKTINGWEILSMHPAILDTHWGQNEPYDMYCPIYKDDILCATGCVPTAFAQILSHFKTITKCTWNDKHNKGSVVLHWDQIMSDCKNQQGRLYARNTQSAKEVAGLMRYLGSKFESKYGEETSTKESAPIYWMQKNSGLNVRALKDYNEDAIRQNIDKGFPVYAQGRRKEKSNAKSDGEDEICGKKGHAWVYDGYCRARKSKNAKSQIMFHCNWGWDGEFDGYYLSRIFDTGSGPVLKDDKDIFYWQGEGRKYEYDLKYSNISTK